MRITIVLMLAAWCLVGGCVSEPARFVGKPAPAVRGPLAPPEKRLQFRGEGVVTVRTDDGRNFDIMWGARPEDNAPCDAILGLEATKTESEYTIYLKRGFVYVAGKIGSDPRRLAKKQEALKAAGKTRVEQIPPWTVVVTEHVEAAADGTAVLVSVDDKHESVFRLHPGKSGKVRVRGWADTGTSTEEILDWKLNEAVMVFDRKGKPDGKPRVLNAERAFRDWVGKTAALSGCRPW